MTARLRPVRSPAPMAVADPEKDVVRDPAETSIGTPPSTPKRAPSPYRPKFVTLEPGAAPAPRKTTRKPGLPLTR